ncbi:hypothetical protein RND81_14G184800 [Saponaria officinalis]|uniref:RNA polymerase II C-terminal domain phosphatase-like n=1 Tax=Saponaria officinalis TaxID=3572 RepID=A0AAW1GNP1_SAPOF
MASPCKHPQFIGNTCVGCKLSKTECRNPPTTPLNYIRPHMSLSIDEINRLRDENLRSLLTRKKLHLILNLDKTLIHVTRIDKLTSEDKQYIEQNQHEINGDGHEYKMIGGVHILRLRPGVRDFIEKLSSIFDISIYTLASKFYSAQITKILDPKGCIFKNVISRGDCTNRSQKGLDVVLSHDQVILIFDDKKRVWGNYTKNLIQIAPYNFFRFR